MVGCNKVNRQFDEMINNDVKLRGDIMTKRNLDGVYFRVMRDGKGVNVCWTDLDWEDRVDMMVKHNSESWLMRMVQIMNAVAEDINNSFPMAHIPLVDFPMDKELSMEWLRTSLMRITADIRLTADKYDIMMWVAE